LHYITWNILNRLTTIGQATSRKTELDHHQARARTEIPEGAVLAPYITHPPPSQAREPLRLRLPPALKAADGQGHEIQIFYRHAHKQRPRTSSSPETNWEQRPLPSQTGRNGGGTQQQPLQAAAACSAQEQRVQEMKVAGGKSKTKQETAVSSHTTQQRGLAPCHRMLCMLTVCMSLREDWLCRRADTHDGY